MNKRTIPYKDEIVKIIDQYKNIKDCLIYFKCDYRTFHRWLKFNGIIHNFHKGKTGYWKGKHLTKSIKNKISITKRNKTTVLKLNRIEHICPICEKKYLTVPKSVSVRTYKKYCSKECGLIALGKWHIGKEKHLSKFFCEICNKEFESYKSLNYNRFCSKECYRKYVLIFKRNKTYEEIYGEARAFEIKSKIAIKTAERNRTIIPLSKPHLLLKQEMMRVGIYENFETCQPLYYFEIDELNTSKKICLEIDGDYWHSLPKRIQQDKRKDTFLTNKGYKVIRIKEKDIYANLENCVNKIALIVGEKND
jgi:very-short-patch-repair endonuclease/endogenous inhibitor of DNA gyrase (YacG/DUF329 family)